MLFPPYIPPPPLPLIHLSLCPAPLVHELVLYLQCIGELVYEKWLITTAGAWHFFFSVQVCREAFSFFLFFLFVFPSKKKKKTKRRRGVCIINFCVVSSLARGVCVSF